MRVISDTVTATAPVNLVRTAVAGDWVAGDNDMNAVYLSMPGKDKFVPVVQALWLSKSSYRPVLPGVVATTKLASRCYLPSLARLADGGCVLACKIFPQSDLEVEVVGKMARAIVAQQSASSDFGFTTTMKTNKPVEEK